MSFLPAILEATNQRGMDIVLNSLSGELLHASWKCVAEFGTMVEIGRRDFAGQGKLAMEMFESNRSFVGFDLMQLVTKRPEMIQRQVEHASHNQAHVADKIEVSFAGQHDTTRKVSSDLLNHVRFFRHRRFQKLFATCRRANVWARSWSRCQSHRIHCQLRLRNRNFVCEPIGPIFLLVV
jgi:NADPH:quinone reductase-like Zn-dependent oxidoreductase